MFDYTFAECNTAEYEEFQALLAEIAAEDAELMPSTPTDEEMEAMYNDYMGRA